MFEINFFLVSQSNQIHKYILNNIVVIKGESYEKLTF